MRALIACLLLFAAPLHAAEPIAWTPPLVGTVVVHEVTVGDVVVPGTWTVVAVDGDRVVTESRLGGAVRRETSFRGIVNLVSASVTFDYDEVALRALWPLAPGKRVGFAGWARRDGITFPFDAELAVEALETLQTPAGTFRTALVVNDVAMDTGGIVVRMHLRMWLDAKSGVVVKAQIYLSENDRPRHAIAMEATEGPTPP